MQAVLQSLERQHEEEKRSALERQRQMYEQELQQLRKKLNPDRLSTGQPGGQTSVQPGQGQQSHYRSLERLSVGGMSHSTSAQSRLRQWSEDRCVWACLGSVFKKQNRLTINCLLMVYMIKISSSSSAKFILLDQGCPKWGRGFQLDCFFVSRQLRWLMQIKTYLLLEWNYIPIENVKYNTFYFIIFIDYYWAGKKLHLFWWF